jgi:hypothetical protein
MSNGYCPMAPIRVPGVRAEPAGTPRDVLFMQLLYGYLNALALEREAA